MHCTVFSNLMKCFASGKDLYLIWFLFWLLVELSIQSINSTDLASCKCKWIDYRKVISQKKRHFPTFCIFTKLNFSSKVLFQFVKRNHIKLINEENMKNRTCSRQWQKKYQSQCPRNNNKKKKEATLQRQGEKRLKSSLAQRQIPICPSVCPWEGVNSFSPTVRPRCNSSCFMGFRAEKYLQFRCQYGSHSIFWHCL